MPAYIDSIKTKAFESLLLLFLYFLDVINMRPVTGRQPCIYLSVRHLVICSCTDSIIRGTSTVGPGAVL